MRVTEALATIRYTVLGLVLGSGTTWSLVALMLGTEETQCVLLIGTCAGSFAGYVCGGWIGAIRVGRIIDALHELEDEAATERLATIEAGLPRWTSHIA